MLFDRVRAQPTRLPQNQNLAGFVQCSMRNRSVWSGLILFGWCLLSNPDQVYAQQRLSWSTLEACEQPSGRIAFTSDVKRLEQQLVKIKGFMIPLDTEGKEYALSAYPMSECFFCGNAGPTSMVELVLREPRRYHLDDYVTFIGNLILIPGSQGLVFRLENAEED